ncbi:MAG TPA: response regulator transcription factor [Chloroflexota bacterium]|nr:response regulator transcription factor [Chloroflexota bacterium]
MSGPQKILVIDDSPDMLKVLTLLLTEHGYEVLTALNGQIGLRLVNEQHPDLVILDLSMPGIDGWEVCRQIRTRMTVPIIILTAAHVTDEDTVRGLELGANDYIIKPFKNNLLLARIRNALRWATPEHNGLAYDDGQLVINLDMRQVTYQGEPLNLTRKEFEMLTVLVQASPRVVTHRELFDKVWADSYHQFDVNYVRIFIGHLRKKLEANTTDPVYIHNERGVGYRFQKQPNSSRA